MNRSSARSTGGMMGHGRVVSIIPPPTNLHILSIPRLFFLTYISPWTQLTPSLLLHEPIVNPYISCYLDHCLQRVATRQFFFSEMEMRV